MSYEIFYDKNFIKVEKDNKTQFVPMVYGGSNNCYEYSRSGRGRRSRNWFVFSYLLNGGTFGTLEEMLEKANKEREKTIESNRISNERYIAEGHADWISEYSDKSFGWFTSLAIGGSTSNTSFSKYIGFIKTGCRKALTVEEMKEFGVSVYFYTSIYSKEKEKAFLDSGKKEIHHTVNTSAELVEKLKEFEEYLHGTGVSLYLSMDADEDDMRRLRRSKFPKQKKEIVNTSSLSEYFVIYDSIKNNYILKFTARGYKYSHYGSSHCKRFADKKAAERYAKRVNEKYREGNRYVVETIKNESYA